MSCADWYRQSAWTSEASDEFEARLSRSRGARAEYLRIQALTLAESVQAESARAAIALAKRYLAMEPRGIRVAQMHATIAKALTTLGDLDGASEAYVAATDAEYRQPNVRGCHYIDFAWFAATHARPDLFEKVMTVVERNRNDHDLALPVNQYRYFGALALISGALGDKEHAIRMARCAMSAAGKERGPFRMHPDLRGVETLDHDVHSQLQRLAVG